MIKSLTVQEVAKKLAGEGKPFNGFVRDDETQAWIKEMITGVDYNEVDGGIFTKHNCYEQCGIEIPDEYEPYPDNECPPLNCGDVIISKEEKVEYLVLCVNERKTERHYISTYAGRLDNGELFKDYTHKDGTPIGKIKEITL